MALVDFEGAVEKSVLGKIPVWYGSYIVMELPGDFGGWAAFFRGLCCYYCCCATLGHLALYNLTEHFYHAEGKEARYQGCHGG